MPLAPGDKLGPYEIVEAIGKGGMGEEYRARDTRLGREVAVKVAAQRFGERFEQEARVISSLNHPNICTLHDVGDNYLVMEIGPGPHARRPHHTGTPPAWPGQGPRESATRRAGGGRVRATAAFSARSLRAGDATPFARRVLLNARNRPVE